MSENKEKIHIIATGGTIDGVYDPSSERKVTGTKSSIRAYLEKTIAPHFSIELNEIMMIDSLDMTDNHREKIVDAINATETKKILITHGTSAMVETAQFINKNITDNNKTIILVGAMIPLEGFYPTDAPFNLGYAIAQAQTRDAGIYLCMNAQCFTPDNTTKNIDAARFEFKDET